MQPSGTSKFQIGPARAQDFDELMDMLAACFRIADPNHPKIEEIFPDIYKPRELEMSWNLLARDNGTIVGCVTVVPVAIDIGSKIIEICAIGGEFE